MEQRERPKFLWVGQSLALASAILTFSNLLFGNRRRQIIARGHLVLVTIGAGYFFWEKRRSYYRLGAIGKRLQKQTLKHEVGDALTIGFNLMLVFSVVLIWSIVYGILEGFKHVLKPQPSSN